MQKILFIFDVFTERSKKKRVSEQANIPLTPTLLNNAVHNGWQCHAYMMGNRTGNHNQISVKIGYT